MSNFNIDDEIDKTIDKIIEQLKFRLKKLVVRSEKQILRQYIASQKETTKVGKIKNSSVRVTGQESKSGDNVKKKALSRHSLKSEASYDSASESESSESD